MLCTRPDLTTAVNIFSRYSGKNNSELWQCLKRVLRYLKGTIEMKLIFKRSAEFKNTLIGYVDSDWGGNEIDRRSTTGYLFKMFDLNLICWNTKRQNSVAASSTEAEYMALFEAVREALWAKHIDIKYHFAREQIESNTICVEYIYTENHLADIFTKPLPAAKSLALRHDLGLLQDE